MPRLFLLVSIFALAGCAAIVPITGSTRAGEVLAADTRKEVVMMAKIYGNCDKVDSIEAQKMELYPPGNRRETAAAWNNGTAREIWTADACNKKLPFDVWFTPDGKGGTFIRVRYLPNGNSGPSTGVSSTTHSK